MRVADQPLDHRVGLDQCAARDTVAHRADLAAALAGVPGTVALGQHQVDHAEVVAPAPGHHRRHTVQRAAGDVRAGQVGVVVARELAV
jgi:hypothetical protein